MEWVKLIVGPNQKLEINVGDYVLAYKPKLTDEKLSTLWQGPFKVLKNYSTSSYILIDPEAKTRYRRSVHHLRPIGPKINDAIQNRYKDHNIDESNLVMQGIIGLFSHLET